MSDTRSAPLRRPARIVLTGGPGGGKTTAADLFRREIGECVALVPEAATMLFTGGFPRVDLPAAVRAAQAAIFHVQRNHEDVYASLYPGRLLLCDRGTVDGAAYWPGDLDEFFAGLGTSLAAELARYDAVVFFETAAAGGHDICSANSARIETTSQAVQLDLRLRQIWSGHPRFHLVAHNPSFFKKITAGLETMERLVRELTASDELRAATELVPSC
ncbi:AAA family ATPase [Nannocystis sp. ILAH1]|uniref:AAA family ATPase n=1 Tax=Nannocystis sp. ILAH1 TaxID=2996789 RepID=UPI00226E6C2F|nr:AAA family ATPase [Nannocystis sp. ILAH1]MCY0989789.1 AAA family ATPase [Nannocystis sp. ILAH1]